MRLYEFEAKQLWKEYGIAIPSGDVFTRDELGTASMSFEDGECVVKAQTLDGKRAQRGLIAYARNAADAQTQALAMLAQSNAESHIEKILIEQRVPHEFAIYISITYSTASRSPILLLARNGGTGIEEARAHVQRYTIDHLVGLHPANIRQLAYHIGLSTAQIQSLVPVAMQLWKCFYEQDCTLAEINPLVFCADGQWRALDAKVELDVHASFRRKNHRFPPRHTLGRMPTAAELAAWHIDKNDHRGVAGTSYIDLDGDIAILASGGGASLACMDALIAHGGKPANYTEYSGNPPREKVQKLTEIVLSKPNLVGCWVVGVTANFTDILETLTGFVDGVRATHPKPTYPFLIRRAGPHDAEAFAMLTEVAKKEGYDFHLYGSDMPMISTAKKMMDLIHSR
jgi:succinyl-CoA synthetase beta subunit